MKNVLKKFSFLGSTYLAGNIQGVGGGEKVQDSLRVQEVALVVESLAHLDEGEGGEVPDPVGLGGLLVVDPDQRDPIAGHLLTYPLQDAENSVAGLAVLAV